jgi:hypothetical protein
MDSFPPSLELYGLVDLPLFLLAKPSIIPPSAIAVPKLEASAGDDGVVDLVQVAVRPRHRIFRWKKVAYTIDQATASVISRDSGRAKNDPKRPDENEVVDVAGRLTSECDSQA